MTAADPDPHVERLLAAFADHDVDRYMDQYADDVTFRDPYAGEIGKVALREYVRDLFAGFPDARIERRQVVARGDTTVVEGAFVGTHEGPYQGIPPTGNSAELPATLVMTVSDDGITSRRDYWDQQAFREKLGLTVPAVIGHLPSFALWTLRNAL